MMKIRTSEIYRYLGYRGTLPGPEVIQRVDRCFRELEKAAEPRFVCKRLPVSWISGEPFAVRIATIHTDSRDLARNLFRCQEAFVFAATLGLGPDRLIRRAQLLSMADAAIYQAVSTEMIEAWCNQKNEELKEEIKKEGLFCRPRYSPGYGDCPLTIQKEISQILEMPKSIGVCLTDTLLMLPTKSVTAFVGISDRPFKEILTEIHAAGQETYALPRNGCFSCSLTDCSFRMKTDGCDC